MCARFAQVKFQCEETVSRIFRGMGNLNSQAAQRKRKAETTYGVRRKGTRWPKPEDSRTGRGVERGKLICPWSGSRRVGTSLQLGHGEGIWTTNSRWQRECSRQQLGR